MKHLFLSLFIFSTTGLFAQTTTPSDSLNINIIRINRMLDVFREFRIVTYLQTEWQRADTVGAASYAGGNFPVAANNRFLVRRGRFRLSYEHVNPKNIKEVEVVFQFDATERGFVIKDFYGKLTDPWIGWFSLQGGIFRRQFGYETPANPAFSESPELARINQTILPNEQELGENLVVESPTNFKPVHLRVDAGLVNGEGIGVGSETGTYQGRKDFLGRVWVDRNFHTSNGVKINLAGSGSLYYGSVLQTTKNVYALEMNSHGDLVYTNIADTLNINKQYYKRIYYGAHAQLDLDYKAGTTLFRGEYITGLQPGTATGSGIPTGVGNAPPGVDLYLRRFNGGIFYFSQTIRHKLGGHPVSHAFTVKFDWYNPNAQESQKNLNSEVDARKSGADILYRTYGFGYTFHPYEWVKFVIWYDVVKNPDTGVKGFGRDMKDNVLTLRTQFYIDTWWFNR